MSILNITSKLLIEKVDSRLQILLYSAIAFYLAWSLFHVPFNHYYSLPLIQFDLNMYRSMFQVPVIKLGLIVILLYKTSRLLNQLNVNDDQTYSNTFNPQEDIVQEDTRFRVKRGFKNTER